MERIAFGIYLFVIIVSPLLFGAVHTYAYSMIFFLILAASLLLVVHNIRKDYKSGLAYFQYPKTGLNFLFFSIFILLIMQVLPLPSFLVGLLSPQALDVKSQAAELTGKKQIVSLAPYIYPVRMSLIRWTVYGLYFLGLTQVTNSRKRIEILCLCILITATFISLYGIYQSYAGDNMIWWFAGYGGDVRGTYINRNHFAGMMAMALMLTAAYASSVRTSFPQINDASTSNSKLENVDFLSSDQVYSKRSLIIFCGVMIGLGLVLSASRGGIISAAFGLLLMGTLFVYRKSHRRNGLIVLLLFLFIGGYGLWVGLEHAFVRFQSDQLQTSFEGRFRYAQKTMDLFKDYKLTGVGVGNFQHAYPQYQAPKDMGLMIDYAHDDWAQLLAEAGLLGLILTVSGITVFVFKTVRIWLERKDHKAIALGVLPLAMFITLGIHSWVDFNMHIPANVLILVAILVVGQASLSIRARKFGERFELRFQKVPLDLKGSILISMLLLFIAWSLAWSVRHFAAESYCNTVPNSTLNRERNPPAAEIAKAISWDRYNAEYWYKLGLAQQREKSGKGYEDDVTDALETAILLNPFSAVYFLELGWSYTRRWQEEDFAEIWLPKADQAMDQAGFHSGASYLWLHYDVANYWLMRSMSFAPGSKQWEATFAKAGIQFQQALDLQNKKKRVNLLKDIRTTVWRYYPDAGIFDELGLQVGGEEKVDELGLEVGGEEKIEEESEGVSQE